MENAIWDGKCIMASEIAKNYDKEKAVRKASGRKELLCPDPECKNKILRYCHGEKRQPYFAHINNEHCDYADFDLQNTNLTRTIRTILYEQFTSQGYNVKPEIKILPHHYTHLLIELDANNKIAIEIATQHISANRIDNLSDEYRKLGVPVKWIVISDATHPVKENETFFIKRYALNESKNKDLIVVNWDGKTASQYKTDESKYIYKDREIRSRNYPETYSEIKPIENLTIENEELSFRGFHDRYKDWHDKKTKAFQALVNSWEEQEKDDALKREQRRQELLQTQKKRLEEQRASIELPCTHSAPAMRTSAIELHKQTGLYVGSKIQGKYETFTIDELTQRRPIQNYLRMYSRVDFEKRVQEIRNGEKTGVQHLFWKMCFISKEENKLLHDILDELKENDTKTANIVSYLYEKATTQKK